MNPTTAVTYFLNEWVFTENVNVSFTHIPSNVRPNYMFASGSFTPSSFALKGTRLTLE